VCVCVRIYGSGKKIDILCMFDMLSTTKNVLYALVAKNTMGLFVIGPDAATRTITQTHTHTHTCINLRIT
jgi:hypothetical protein